MSRGVWKGVTAFAVTLVFFAGAALLPTSLGLIERLATAQINDAWPPRTPELSRAESRRLTFAALETMGQPHLSLVLEGRDTAAIVQEAVRLAAASGPVRLDSIEVTLGEQEIRFRANFNAEWPSESVGAAGTAEGAVALSIDRLSLVLTPNLERVQLRSVSTGRWFYLPSGLAGTLNPLLRDAIANLNGAIEPARIALLDDLPGSGTLRIGTRDIPAPDLRLRSAAMLVSPEAVFALAELGGAEPAPVTGLAPEVDQPTLRAAFIAKGGSLLNEPLAPGLRLSRNAAGLLFGPLAVTGDRSTRREAAANAARDGLATLRGPDLAAFVPAAEVRGRLGPLLEAAMRQAASRSGVEVRLFDVTIAEGEVLALSEVVLPIPQPIGGTATLRLEVAASPVLRGMSVVLLPSLVDLQVISLDTEAPGFQAAPLISSVNRVLPGLVAGLSEGLPAMPIDFEPLRVPSLDLTASARTPGLTVQAPTLSPEDFQFGAGALRLGEDGLELLVDLEAPSLRVREAAPSVAGGTLFEAFSTVRERRFGPVPVDRLSVAVAWQRAAEAINARWQALGTVRATYRADTGARPLESTEIRLIERPTYSCRSDRSCAFQSTANECRRADCNQNCTRRTSPWTSWDDPICLADRLRCNLQADAQYGACVLARNAEANARKADCDRLRVMEEAGCNIGRDLQRLFAEVGSIGRIGGEMRAVVSAQLDLGSLRFRTDEVAAMVDARVSAQAQVSGAIDFTPYNVGHLLVCPAKGRAPVSLSVSIPDQPLAVSIRTEVPDAEGGDGALRLALRLDPSGLRANVRPPPVDALITQNPHLLVVCNPVIGTAVAGLTLAGRATALASNDVRRAVARDPLLSTILLGTLEYDVPEFLTEVTVPALELRLPGNEAIRMAPTLSARALVFSARER